MHADVESFLEVGAAAVFSCDPSGQDRCKTAIRGWRNEGYVLLDLPSSPPNTLARSASCVVRFVAGGQACGFESRVLNPGTRSAPYIQITWPQHIESVEFRRYQRVQIAITCRARDAQGEESEGTIRDLSAGGCRIQLDRKLPVGSAVHVSFRLPDGTQVDDAPCVVRNCNLAEGGILHGCQFD